MNRRRAALLGLLAILAATSAAIAAESNIDVIDDFEDGDLSEYGTAGGSNHESGSFSTSTDWSANGSVSLRGTTEGQSGYHAFGNTNGAIHAPEPGDVFSYTVNFTNIVSTKTGLLFGFQNNSHWYQVNVNVFDTEVAISKRTGGSGTNLDRNALTGYDRTEVPNGIFTVRTRWRENGEILVRVTNQTGHTVGTAATRDTTFTSGGVGWAVSSASISSGTEVYMDYAIDENAATMNDSLTDWPGGTIVDDTVNGPTLVYSDENGFEVLPKRDLNGIDLWTASSPEADEWTETENVYRFQEKFIDVWYQDGAYYAINQSGDWYKGPDISSLSVTSHNISNQLDHNRKETNLFVENGTWYAVTSGDASWQSDCCVSTTNELYSADSWDGTWTHEGTIVNRSGDSWGTGDPHLNKLNGTYYLFADKSSGHAEYWVAMWSSDTLSGSESDWTYEGQVTSSYGGDPEVEAAGDKLVMVNEYPHGTTDAGWQVRYFNSSLFGVRDHPDPVIEPASGSGLIDVLSSVPDTDSSLLFDVANEVDAALSRTYGSLDRRWFLLKQRLGLFGSSTTVHDRADDVQDFYNDNSEGFTSYVNSLIGDETVALEAWDTIEIEMHEVSGDDTETLYWVCVVDNSECASTELADATTQAVDKTLVVEDHATANALSEVRDFHDEFVTADRAAGADYQAGLAARYGPDLSGSALNASG